MLMVCALVVPKTLHDILGQEGFLKQVVKWYRSRLGFKLNQRSYLVKIDTIETIR
jgi:hypothetical protein